MADADPAHYVRGQYDGYREIDGCRQATRRPRPTPRCGSRSTTGAGRACRSSSAPASGCRSSRPSCGWCSSTRRKLHFIPSGSRRPEPNQIVFRIDPGTGIRMVLDAHRADRGGTAEIELDMEFARGGRRGRRRPTRCCCTRRWSATAATSPARTASRRRWRVVQPLLDRPPPVHPYAPGTWGPRRRTSWSPASAAGTTPGCPASGAETRAGRR